MEDRLDGHDAVAALQAARNQTELPAPGVLRTGFAAHQLRQASGDGQAESGAAVLARRRGVALLEGIKQAGELFGDDADAGVSYLEANQQLALDVLKQFGA